MKDTSCAQPLFDPVCTVGGGGCVRAFRTLLPREFYGATQPIAAVERSIRVDGESMSLVSMGTGQS